MSRLNYGYGYGYGYANNRYDNRFDRYDKYESYRIDEYRIRMDFKTYADQKTKRIESEKGYQKMGNILGINIETDLFIIYPPKFDMPENFSFITSPLSIDESSYSSHISNII